MSKMLFIFYFANFDIIKVGSIVSHESPSAEMSFHPRLPSIPISYSSLKSARHNLNKRNIILTKNNFDKDDDEMKGRISEEMRETEEENDFLSAANVDHVMRKSRRKCGRRGRGQQQQQQQEGKVDFDLKNQEEEGDGFKSSPKFHSVILSSTSGPIPFLSLPSQQSKSFQTFASSAKTCLSPSPSTSFPSTASPASSLGSSEFQGLQNLLKKKKWIQEITSPCEGEHEDSRRERGRKNGQRQPSGLEMEIRQNVPISFSSLRRRRQGLSKLKQGDRTTRHDIVSTSIRINSEKADDDDEDDDHRDNIPTLHLHPTLSGSDDTGVVGRLKSFEEEKSWNVEKSFLTRSLPPSGNKMRIKTRKRREKEEMKNKSIIGAVSSSSRKSRSNPRLLSRKKRFFLTGTFQLPSLFLEVLSMMRKS